MPHHANKTSFKKGQIPMNKGKPLEEFVGTERARKIRQQMSDSSKGKATFLMGLNKNPQILAKRKSSRLKHENYIMELLYKLRLNGEKVFPLSQYVRDEKQPDLILVKDGKLIAIEVEQDKRYKASRKTIERKYERMHKKNKFFDEVKTIWLVEGRSEEPVLSEV